MKIRKAQKKDKEQIIAIASHTWEGWDYVPYLLDEWLTEGGLFVAEENSNIVGITKTTTLSEDELWLEGIRVKPELRGKGIGKKLAFYQLEEALKAKPRVIRLSTVETNKESISIIEKMGFHKAIEFKYLSLENLSVKGKYSHIRKCKNKKKVQGYIENSQYLNESKGLLPWTWIFREINPSLFPKYIENENVLIKQKNGEIISLVILLPHRYEKETLEIGFLDGQDEKSIEEMFQFAHSYANQNYFNKITFFSPSLRLEKPALKAGFSFPYDFKKIPVYELFPD
jgi:ribosomal protein S18 acetylase RimI-like enzyme